MSNWNWTTFSNSTATDITSPLWRTVPVAHNPVDLYGHGIISDKTAREQAEILGANYIAEWAREQERDAAMGDNVKWLRARVREVTELAVAS
jgi:hypothetical protein